MKVINNKASVISLDSLYQCAKKHGFFVDVEEDTWRASHRVELKYTNPKGTRFYFEGKSMDSLQDAFLNAFNEAEVIGKGYE